MWQCSEHLPYVVVEVVHLQQQFHHQELKAVPAGLHTHTHTQRDTEVPQVGFCVVLNDITM
jgi:hypothetical protein